MEDKICIRCKESKNTDLFNKDSSRFDGLSNICKECDKRKVAKWQIENKNKHNERSKRWRKVSKGYFPYLRKHQATRFGLTLDQVDKMLIDQSGLCAICKNQMSGKLDPAIDHNRSCCKSRESCGKCVRAMLCNGCNSLLAFSRDNIETLKNAIKYLRKYS